MAETQDTSSQDSENWTDASVSSLSESYDGQDDLDEIMHGMGVGIGVRARSNMRTVNRDDPGIVDQRNQQRCSVRKQIRQREIEGSKYITSMLPNKTTKTLVRYSHRAYSGQFSTDGSFFYSCTQDLKVHIYDSSSPTELVKVKELRADYGRWTVTDCTLAADNKFLCFASISPRVFLSKINVNDWDDQSPTPLELAEDADFGVWSIRFSGDGRELVAGTSDHSVYVYDIETRTVLHAIRGHADDVNAVCFADPLESHVFYSGSDDGTIKVWDRRSLINNKPAGVFVGHTEGITFVDSKGDGRYCLSNSKDQSMKLWDIRRMVDNSDPSVRADLSTGFDYRFQRYPAFRASPHPRDQSVVTYTSHAVVRTLIRCYFSPQQSTGQKYVYTGSADEHVYIYATDTGKLVGKIDAKVNRTPANQMGFEDYISYDHTVRDVAWHPHQPLMISSHWTPEPLNSGTPAGALVLHEFSM